MTIFKMGKYLRCTHNVLLIFIDSGQDLGQHVDLLMLISNHFAQLLDHVALATFRV